MRTIMFLLCGLICFGGITWLQGIDQLPLFWYVALCFGGIILVGFLGYLRYLMSTTNPDVESSNYNYK